MATIRPGKDATTWTRRNREFVAKFRDYGRGITLRQFCKIYNFKLPTYEKWRKIPEFRAEVDAIKQLHIDEMEQGHLTAEYEEDAIVSNGLTRRQNLFIAHYRETYDRANAMKLSGWDVADYEQNLMGSEEFKTRIAYIEQELEIKIQDKLLIKAASGNASALRQLERRTAQQAKPASPRASQPTAAGAKKSHQLWGERFGLFEG